MTTRSAELLRGLPHEYQLTMDYIKVRSIDPFSRFLEKSLAVTGNYVLFDFSSFSVFRLSSV